MTSEAQFKQNMKQKTTSLALLILVAAILPAGCQSKPKPQPQPTQQPAKVTHLSGVTRQGGQTYQTKQTFVNEPGMYTLIQENKPIHKKKARQQ